MSEIKKPLYKKWWFWVIIVIFIIAIGAMIDDEEATKESNNNESVPASSQVDDEESEKENEVENEDVNENNNENTSENTDEATETSAEPKTEYSINEKVEFEGRVFEVINVEYSDGTQFDKPKSGMEYVIVTISIENNSDKQLSYNPFHFKMQNSQGQIQSQTFTIVDSDTSLSSGELAPGGSVSGTIAFEQPKDDPDLKLIFESPSFFSSERLIIDLK